MIFKKLTIFLFIFFWFFNLTYAWNQTFSNPTFWDISWFNPPLYEWYNPSNSSRIWVYRYFTWDGTSTQTSQQFCLLQWATFVSHDITTNYTTQDTTYFYIVTSEWWNWDYQSYLYNSITCNFPDVEPEEWHLSSMLQDLDLSSFDNYEQKLYTSTWTIDYSKQISDSLKLQYQTNILLMLLCFFMFFWIFYTFLNDLLWKN